MIKLLSGNEALALGAYQAGVCVATAYPGTPSTEILESMARFHDIHTEWSTNEKVAMEVAMGAAYAGVRSLVSMKHVGLNVASDPFLAVSTTGINAGMVVISADDPGIHSSQNEQDNRHYARLAKVPMLEPGDSQEAYELMAIAYDISEKFDTPVLVRTTTRISHSKSVVKTNNRRVEGKVRRGFNHNAAKYVLLPTFARQRHKIIEERLIRLTEYAETFAPNRITWGERSLGIVTSGIAYQYAREIFPKASFLKLGMTYPLPANLIHRFAAGVDRVIVIEELNPFIEDSIRAMGIAATGKEFIPRTGELNPTVIEDAGRTAGLLPPAAVKPAFRVPELPQRPPILCPGCPHTGLYFVLGTLGKRLKSPRTQDKQPRKPTITVAGDIGCYTLGTYPPLNALDTCACMGAGIGQATGMEKAGMSSQNVVAVIGDSTFLHSGITPLINAVYNEAGVTIIILDNRTTAMTGHQEHPGTGISAQGKKTRAIDLESLCRATGTSDVKVVSAFNLKDIRAALRSSLDNPEVSVMIVRGECSVRAAGRHHSRAVDTGKCNQCGLCLQIGCPAIRQEDGVVYIDPELCAGEICAICQQACPRQAIGPESEIKSRKLS
ncbi:MAG: indolepyruvate ferredoxin oxidoreductase subunit alpha [Dehalococcoidales bacterium]